MADIDRYRDKDRRREKCRLYTMNGRRRQIGLEALKEAPAKKSTPEPTKQATERDIGWAAGFLEGEGWFGYYKNKNRRKGEVRISASQINLEPLQRLQELFGGYFWEQIWKNPRPSGRARTSMHWWAANGVRAARIMELLRTELSQRRKDQIDIALTKWGVDWHGDSGPLETENTS